MKKMTTTKFALGLVLVAMSFVSTAHSRQIELNPTLTEKLLAILQASEVLHGALFEKNSENIERQLEALDISLSDAIRGSELAQGESFLGMDRVHSHLLRVLNETRTYIKSAIEGMGKDRHEHIKEAFRQIVTLSSTYKLSKDYHVFFCRRDRSVWIQKGWRAKYPFLKGKRDKCGIVVR